MKFAFRVPPELHGTAYLCSLCGDRCVWGVEHTCWVEEKFATQEQLAPPLVPRIPLTPLRRDDGRVVPEPPPYIHEGGVIIRQEDAAAGPPTRPRPA